MSKKTILATDDSIMNAVKQVHTWDFEGHSLVFQEAEPGVFGYLVYNLENAIIGGGDDYHGKDIFDSGAFEDAVEMVEQYAAIDHEELEKIIDAISLN